MTAIKKKNIGRKFTLTTCLSELKIIRISYQKANKGYREEFRAMMERAQCMIARFRSNRKLRGEFKKSVLSDRKERGTRSKKDFNLSLEVMAKATGAVSRRARKVASKRAKVLDYLRKIHVDAWKTAITIKKKGGVDNILAEATALTRLEDKTDESEDTSTEEGSETQSAKRSNNRTILVPVWMKISDRDDIAESPVGSGFALKSLRVGQPGGDLMIVSIRPNTAA